LEKYIASIFRVEEHAKQETNVKQVASTGLLACHILQPEDGGDMFL
jgi:hypothetical protein